MICKKFMNTLKGQNHQHRATPCDWSAESFQALKGCNSERYPISPFQCSNLRAYPFHRTTPDALANMLSAFTVKNLYGKTSFLPNSKNKTTSVAIDWVQLPEPHYLIFVVQLGNKVIFGGRHLSTEVVLSNDEVEMRFSNFNYFERVFPFHRTTPDVNTKRLSAFTKVIFHS